MRQFRTFYYRIRFIYRFDIFRQIIYLYRKIMEETVICSDALADMECLFPREAPARNTFRGLYFVMPATGEAMVEIDSRPHRLYPGVLLTLLPGHALQTVSHSHDFRCLLLSVPFEYMNDFPYMLQSCISEKMEQMPYLLLSPDEQALLKENYGAIARHYPQTSHSSYREIMRCLFFVLPPKFVLFIQTGSSGYLQHTMRK